MAIKMNDSSVKNICEFKEGILLELQIPLGASLAAIAQLTRL